MTTAAERTDTEILTRAITRQQLLDLIGNTTHGNYSADELVKEIADELLISLCDDCFEDGGVSEGTIELVTAELSVCEACAERRREEAESWTRDLPPTRTQIH